MPEKNIIVVFSKPPVPGKTKQRLAAEIGNRAAADFSATMLAHIICEIRKLSDTKKYLFYPPDASIDEYSSIVNTNDIIFLPQEGHNLGERMKNTFKCLFLKETACKIIIIGSDCITHSAELFVEAFRRLDDNEVVLQPTEDGGYALVGQSHIYKKNTTMFDNIGWSSNKVMKQTENYLQTHGVTYAKLPLTFDIDTAEDLKKIQNWDWRHK